MGENGKREKRKENKDKGQGKGNSDNASSSSIPIPSSPSGGSLLKVSEALVGNYSSLLSISGNRFFRYTSRVLAVDWVPPSSRCTFPTLACLSPWTHPSTEPLARSVGASSLFGRRKKVPESPNSSVGARSFPRPSQPLAFRHPDLRENVKMQACPYHISLLFSGM